MCLQSKAAAELARQAADMADQFAAIKQRIAQAKAEAAALIPPLTNADKVGPLLPCGLASCSVLQICRICSREHIVSWHASAVP